MDFKAQMKPVSRCLTSITLLNFPSPIYLRMAKSDKERLWRAGGVCLVGSFWGGGRVEIVEEVSVREGFSGGLAGIGRGFL
jgi:hypothetical protein